MGGNNRQVDIHWELGGERNILLSFYFRIFFQLKTKTDETMGVLER
jgi:hypothetical protein